MSKPSRKLVEAEAAAARLEEHQQEVASLHRELREAQAKAEALEALVKVLHDGLELAGHRVHQYDRHIQSFALCDQYPCDGIKPLLALTPAEAQAQREDSDAGH